MTKPGYHQKSNQPHGQARHYLQVGGFNQPQPIGGGPGGAGETKSAPRQASPRQEVGSAQVAYLRLGTPTYTHNPDLAVVLLLRAPKYCSMDP